jgi:hypothetical protein
MTDKPALPPEPLRPFADVLLELSKGRVHADAAGKLQEVIAAVVDTRKPGALTLTLRVAPDKADGMVRVTADLKTKVPQLDRESLFFVDAGGNLRRDDPRQQHLPIQLVTEREANR